MASREGPFMNATGGASGTGGDGSGEHGWDGNRSGRRRGAGSDGSRRGDGGGDAEGAPAAAAAAAARTVAVGQPAAAARATRTDGGGGGGGGAPVAACGADWEPTRRAALALVAAVGRDAGAVGGLRFPAEPPRVAHAAGDVGHWWPRVHDHVGTAVAAPSAGGPPAPPAVAAAAAGAPAVDGGGGWMTAAARAAGSAAAWGMDWAATQAAGSPFDAAGRALLAAVPAAPTDIPTAGATAAAVDATTAATFCRACGGRRCSVADATGTAPATGVVGGPAQLPQTLDRRLDGACRGGYLDDAARRSGCTQRDCKVAGLGGRHGWRER